jgi:hypothetical protein
MKTETSDPIVDEVRKARDKHAAQFKYDIKEIFRNVRTQQQSSGRQYVRYPARPTSAAAPETSTG